MSATRKRSNKSKSNKSASGRTSMNYAEQIGSLQRENGLLIRQIETKDQQIEALQRQLASHTAPTPQRNDNETTTEQNKPLQDPLTKIKLERNSFKRKLNQARKHNTAKELKMEALEERLSRSYTISAVHVLETPTEETQHQKDLRNNRCIHEDSALYQKHRDIVSEWNVLTQTLQKLAEPLIEENDDEKEPADQKQETLSTDEILRQYEQSHCLIHQQQTRLKRMEHVLRSDLVSHQNGLIVMYFC